MVDIMVDITKEFLLEMLQNTEDDAVFSCRRHDKNYTEVKLSKKDVEDYINKMEHLVWNNINQLTLDFDLYVQLSYFYNNINYITTPTEGFKELSYSRNKYFNIFYKIDKEKKSFSYKLGDVEKEIELVSSVELTLEDLEELDKRIHDKDMEYQTIFLGRQLLQIPVVA
ncbi:hypothetical protein bcgnr5390_10620 [Bacillus luti]|nr:hypothetical protein BC2903_30280 [Bacillus cereus]